MVKLLCSWGAFSLLLLVWDGLLAPVFGVFQGTRHALAPTLVALCALTSRVIITYLVKDSDWFGHTIIWWNGLFGFSLGCFITWCYYFSNRWQKNATGKAE